MTLKQLNQLVSERKRHAEKISGQRGGVPTEVLKKEIGLWRQGK